MCLSFKKIQVLFNSESLFTSYLGCSWEGSLFRISVDISTNASSYVPVQKSLDGRPWSLLLILHQYRPVLFSAVGPQNRWPAECAT